MKNLVFLLEEKSAEAMLKIITKRILPSGVATYFITFEGKQDLERNVERKIRHWVMPDSSFIVMRDQDSSDCRLVKKELRQKCIQAGRPDALVRIACHELESFYLGDLSAVARAYQISTPAQNSRLYRNPDALANPTEQLRKITQSEYQKLSGSRKIAEFLALDGSNASVSFNVLLAGIRKIAGVPAAS